MILAAGLGTRLRPLTRVRPKVLTPVMGMPLLHYWIERLHKAGFEAVVVNAFHLPDKLVEAVRGSRWPMPVDVRVESSLLGTGGGIRNVLDFFGREPFVVVNGDIICDVDFNALYANHVQSGSRVTMLLHDFPAFNNVAVNGERVAGFGPEAAKLMQEEPTTRLLAFTGIHVLDPDVLSPLEKGRANEIIPVYRQLIHSGKAPLAHLQANLGWREIGSLQAYWALHRELAASPENSYPPLRSGDKICLHADAEISEQADLQGVVVAGRHTCVMGRARLENVILWDHVKVEGNCTLRDCIVTDGVHVKGTHRREIISESK